MDAQNYLSKNIRYLRKSKKWSQEELALKLGIKRSNIAAYESKNVEPRLGLILQMAKLFNVNMAELIRVNIEEEGGIQEPFEVKDSAKEEIAFGRGINENVSPEVLDEFVERSLSIRKMLEGFKIFYRFKKEAATENSESDTSSVDIDNFIHLIDHMLDLNESLIDALGKNHATGRSSNNSQEEEQ